MIASGGFSTWFDRKVSCKEEDFKGVVALISNSRVHWEIELAPVPFLFTSWLVSSILSSESYLVLENSAIPVMEFNALVKKNQRNLKESVSKDSLIYFEIEWWRAYKICANFCLINFFSNLTFNNENFTFSGVIFNRIFFWLKYFKIRFWDSKCLIFRELTNVPFI